MNINILSPTNARIENATTEELNNLIKQLSYVNTAAQHQLKRHYNNHWYRGQNPESWNKTLKELKEAVNCCLVRHYDDSNSTYVRPGSIPYLTGVQFTVNSTISYPISKKMAWSRPLPFELHSYQEESWQRLLEEGTKGPVNVELCTGAGKGAILLKICRETGFRTAVIAPSQSIFLELLEKFEYHFGKSNVGAFGDGKKKLGKRFTICIDDSIANIKPDTKEWDFFSKLDMFCADESHTWGADTLEAICHGILGNVPYRMFFSGTQTRGDGGEKLLQSIIGKTVCTLTTEEAVKKGYICPHEYRVVEIDSSNPNYATSDAIDMKRVHFLRNTNISNFIAKLCAAEARLHKRQTLVLVEELGQVSSLLKLLEADNIPTTVAHAEKKADRLAALGLSKIDRKESIDKFNKGEAIVLIGTSCISTGTNIYPTHNTINWQGGSSEIRTKQGPVGRSVRLGSSNPWAKNCVEKTRAIIWDFDVSGIYVMERHLKDRISYYKDSGTEIKYISLKK